MSFFSDSRYDDYDRDRQSRYDDAPLDDYSDEYEDYSEDDSEDDGVKFNTHQRNKLSGLHFLALFLQREMSSRNWATLQMPRLLTWSTSDPPSTTRTQTTSRLLAARGRQVTKIFCALVTIHILRGGG